MADYPSNEIVGMIMILGECHVYAHAAELYARRYPNRHPTDFRISELTARARNGQLHRQHRHYQYDVQNARVLTILASTKSTLILVADKLKGKQEFQNQQF